MKSFAFRTITVSSVIAAALVVPLHAHHGTQFLTKAMEMNTAEVRMGELGIDKAQNSRVKDFAQMVVRDHNQSLDKIKQLMADRGVKDTGNVKLTPEDQRTYDRLSKLSGADFDREFMATMVSAHRDAIRVFEAQSRAHGNAVTTNKQTDSTTTDRQKPAAPDQKYSRADLARDMDTAEFAKATLPTLRQHLQQAEEIQRSLK
jgi:predicted outer membrane protein